MALWRPGGVCFSGVYALMFNVLRGNQLAKVKTELSYFRCDLTSVHTHTPVCLRTFDKKHFMKAIAYYRVSTAKQGRSGLGLEAQQSSVEQFAKPYNYEIINSFTDVETGKKDNRPQLQLAIEACKKNKAILVIAKLDRLSRDLHFITGMMKSKVDFVCVDNPHATKAMLQMMGIFAEMERDMISTRTKEALKAAKARGVQLGKHGKVLAANNKSKAIEGARDMADHIESLRSQGITSVRRLAAELRKHPTQMQRILARLK